MSSLSPQLIRACPSCGHELPLGATACPKCHALVHGRELDALAREARALEAQRNFSAANELWARSLSMLPPDSKQVAWVRDKMRSLEVASASAEPSRSGWSQNTARKLGPLGPLAILLLKGKGILFALFKLKFLFSLFSFVAIYWALFGWRFGVGFAASILIHEMGHYIDIKRRGLPAEMPVFLPGLGAYVRWDALGVGLRDRAQIALAGPLAGWIAAAVCGLLYFHYTGAGFGAPHFGSPVSGGAFGSSALGTSHGSSIFGASTSAGFTAAGGGASIWSALAHAGAMINILNLIPVWTLDGSQAMNALARPERIALLAAVLALWLFTGQGILFLVAAGIVYRLFTKDLPPRSSWSLFASYSAVLGALTLVLYLLPSLPLHR